MRPWTATAPRMPMTMRPQHARPATPLFSGTIAENLRWGDENATDEEVREAAHLACADEFIDGFPKGYDTWIEQGGSNVSGGQKQRLCIARALLRRPKILILDDSTSAVDTKTDAKIRAGLAAYLPETTKLISAQRTSQNKMGDEAVDGDCSPHADDDAPAACETGDATRQAAEELTHAFETTIQEGGEAHE